MSSDTVQSRWWFILATMVTACVGLFVNRDGASQVDASVSADVRGALSALSAFSILCLGAQLVLVASFTATRPYRSVGRPSRWGGAALFAAVWSGTAAATTFVVIDASLGFRLQVSIATAISVALMILAVPARAVLLGQEKWLYLGAIGVISVIPRLLVAWTPFSDGSVLPTLAAVVAGEFVSTVLAFAVTAKSRFAGSWPLDARRHLAIGLGGSAGIGLLLFLMSTTSRALFGDDSIAFSQSAAVGRAVFVVVFAVAFVFFPAMAKSAIGSVELRRVFHQAVTLTSAAAVVAVVGVFLAPMFFADVVANATSVSSHTTRVLTVAFAAAGIAVVSLMQYISHGSRMALCSWPLVVPMASAHVLVDTSLALAYVSLACAMILLLMVSWPALLRVQPVLRPMLVDVAPTDERATVGTTVVVPSYNPGSIVVSTVRSIVAAFEEAGLPVKVIVVSDGSTDESPTSINRINDPRVSHVIHDTNRGKGAALRTGFALASTPIVAFIDADGDLPPSHLPTIVNIMNATGADIVFGSKRHSQSTVEVPIRRQITSRTYQFLIRLLFQLDIADTQTGVKAFSRSTMNSILPVLEEQGFALDLEMFVAARATGRSNFVEVPVQLVHQGRSTISSRSILQMFEQTLRIFWRAKVALKYLRATSPLPTTGHHSPCMGDD